MTTPVHPLPSPSAPQPVHPHLRQLAVFASLVFASGLCLVFLALRIAYARNMAYIGLAWNLFLAWLPLVSSFAAFSLYRRPLSLTTALVAVSAILWLLFFPNAPYLLTDLMHLRDTGDAPFWYDMIMLISFAWTGFYLGLVSLYLMQDVIRRMLGPCTGWAFALGSLALGSFGIYLGRFLRWNSWDVFTRPLDVLDDILERLLNPFQHAQAVGFSLLFFLFLISAYWMVVALAELDPARPISGGSLTPSLQQEPRSPSSGPAHRQQEVRRP